MWPDKVNHVNHVNGHSVRLRDMGFNVDILNGELVVYLPEKLQNVSGIEYIDLSAIDPEKYVDYIQDQMFEIGFDAGRSYQIKEVLNVLGIK